LVIKTRGNDFIDLSLQKEPLLNKRVSTEPFSSKSLSRYQSVELDLKVDPSIHDEKLVQKDEERPRISFS